MVAEIRTALMQDLRRSVTKRIIQHMNDEPEADWLAHLSMTYEVDAEGLRNNDVGILLALIQLTDEQMHQLEDDVDELVASSLSGARLCAELGALRNAK